MLQSLNIPVPDVKELFNMIDKDQGGFIEFNEFVHWILLNRFSIDI